jgi:hypothetical protein
MRKVMTCLLTITLFLPALAQVRSVGGRDCTTDRFDRIITATLSSPCADETIDVTLNTKTSIKQCLTEDGQTVTTVHSLLHGTGVGTRTGNRYVVNQQAKNFSISTPGCGVSGTFLSRMVLVSKGPQPNERVLLRSTLTLDSNCNTHMDEDLELDCQD